MIKASTQEEDTMLINTYAPNMVPKYIKQILTDVTKKDKNTIIVGDFNAPLTSMEIIKKSIRKQQS